MVPMYLGFVLFCSLINSIVLPCNLWLFLWNSFFFVEKNESFSCVWLTLKISKKYFFFCCWRTWKIINISKQNFSFTKRKPKWKKVLCLGHWESQMRKHDPNLVSTQKNRWESSLFE